MDTPTLLAIRVGDPASAWSAAGFTVVTEAIGPVVHLGGVAIILDQSPPDQRGMTGWFIDGLAPSVYSQAGEIDGLATIGEPERPQRSSAADLTETSSAHPNAISSIDHVVVSTTNLDLTQSRFATAGLEARRTRDTTAGGQPLRQVFYVVSTAIIELIGNPEVAAPVAEAEADLADASDAEDDAADEVGCSSFWGLALNTSDMGLTSATLGDGVGRPKDAVQPGRQIATLRHRDLGISVATAVLTER